jgi:hypothetical protein
MDGCQHQAVPVVQEGCRTKRGMQLHGLHVWEELLLLMLKAVGTRP